MIHWSGVGRYIGPWLFGRTRLGESPAPLKVVLYTDAPGTITAGTESVTEPTSNPGYTAFSFVSQGHDDGWITEGDDQYTVPDGQIGYDHRIRRAKLGVNAPEGGAIIGSVDNVSGLDMQWPSESVSVGDTVVVRLDDGSDFVSTVSAVSEALGGFLTLADALPSLATAGNPMYVVRDNLPQGVRFANSSGAVWPQGITGAALVADVGGQDVVLFSEDAPSTQTVGDGQHIDVTIPLVLS